MLNQINSIVISCKMLVLCCLTALFGFTHGFALPFEGLYKLDIIHYNDFHARFEETSVDTPTCRYNNNSCIGGFPRLYQEIHTLLEQKPDSIVLNAGDSFQGTYWYTLLKWNVTQEFMNLIPHDAHETSLLCRPQGHRVVYRIGTKMTTKDELVTFINDLAIGNHEFDDGPEGLAPYLSALKAPVLAANMDTSEEPVLQGLYRPHLIVKRQGRKIGLIGLITPDTAKLSSPGKVKFTDPKAAAKREAEALYELGVDIIILLSHCGLEVDKEIARDVAEYIDIIVGGHTHSLLWNGDAPSGEPVDGTYPVFVENSADKKHQVLIVQASAFTKYMGNLTVYFDYRGDYVKWEGNPLFLDRSIPEDPTIKAKLAPYAKRVHEAENVPVGSTQNTMRFDDCVLGECTIGNMLVEAQLEFAKKMVPSSPHHYLSFIQRGNIKSSIMQGIITEGSIFELLPFNDRVEIYELEGKYVRQALERSVSDAWAYNPFKGPWLLQVAGLRVVYDISRPEGQRMTSCSVLVGNDAVPLDDSEVYLVTAPAYLSDGGDGFSVFKNKKNSRDIGRDQKILEAYIRGHSPLNIKVDGRILINS